jgi:hypothetical protein
LATNTAAGSESGTPHATTGQSGQRTHANLVASSIESLDGWVAFTNMNEVGEKPTQVVRLG